MKGPSKFVTTAFRTDEPEIIEDMPILVEATDRMIGADFYLHRTPDGLRVSHAGPDEDLPDIVGRVIGAVSSVKRQRERENAVASRMGKRLAEAIREASR